MELEVGEVGLFFEGLRVQVGGLLDSVLVSLPVAFGSSLGGCLPAFVVLGAEITLLLFFENLFASLLCFLHFVAELC